jgi:hypothetical protein
VLLLETDAGVFLEHFDVLVVELNRLFLLARCASFLLLSVPFLGLLLEEFLFDLVVTNDEFFELRVLLIIGAVLILIGRLVVSCLPLQKM